MQRCKKKLLDCSHRKNRSGAPYILIALLFLCCGNGPAQSRKEEPAAVIEVGAATSWSLQGRTASFGPDLAIEMTPIENWLEFELGTTPLFRHHSLEWDTGLLFKKPWTLSEKLEFMFGVGPEWIHTRESGLNKNSFGVEAVLDFMFWPSAQHRLGWFLEPGYDCSFGRGHECSAGISGGLLIAIPRRHR